MSETREADLGPSVEMSLRGRCLTASGEIDQFESGVTALDAVIPSAADVMAVCGSVTAGGPGLAAVTSEQLHLWDATSGLTISLAWDEIDRFDEGGMSLVTIEGYQVQLTAEASMAG